MADVRAYDINDMPLDVLFCVLLWLPVASLCRLKRVCKSWLALIESPAFVRRHLDFASSNDGDSRLIVLSCPDESWDQRLSLVTGNNHELLDIPFVDDPLRINKVKLVGSCNGVICLRLGRVICLWNPATKQSRNVTLPVVPLEPACGWGLLVGFGCDIKTNDYKLLCINIGFTISTFHVYSSQSDGWRTIDDCGLDRDMSIRMSLNTPYRSEVFCMVFSDPADSVTTFDFSNEEFGTIPFHQDIHTLFIMRNNIACISPVTEEVPEWCYEVWMLNDYDDDESWTKVYSADPFVHVRMSFSSTPGFSKNGDFLFFVTDGRLCLYELASREVMDFPVEDGLNAEIVVYSESLVSVSPTDITTYSDRNGRMFIDQSTTRDCDLYALDIPEAVVFRILLWLPVTSLLRFTSVCKSWCALIESSDFVAQHLHHRHWNDNENLNLILYSRNGYHMWYEDSSHLSLKTSPACLLSPDKYQLLDLPFQHHWLGVPNIISSFDGVCLVRLVPGVDDSVYLWNPATKQRRVVQLDSEQLLHYGCLYSPHYFGFGFGFDVKTKDYKLARLILGNKGIARVYSLSTDSWRTIEDEILGAISDIDTLNSLQAPYRSEIYCWLANADRTRTILSFNFGDEVFGALPMPDGVSNSYDVKLAILCENVACIGTDKENPSDGVKIWMMNEYGVGESWTKLYTVGPFPGGWSTLMGYTLVNRDYVLLQEEERLYSCDLVTQETKRLPCQVQLQGSKPEIGVDVGLDFDGLFFEAVIYKESLVPIKGGFR